MPITPLNTMSFTKTWMDPVAFPTYEGSETKVRQDMQVLHDETKSYINEIIIDCINNALIPAIDSLTAFTVPDNSISTAKLVDGAVTLAKMAADSVDTTQIKDGAVTAGKLASGAISAGSLGANAVGNTNIADGAVRERHMYQASVNTNALIDLCVTTAKLAAKAVTTAKIDDAAVTATQLASNAVETAKIKDLNVTTGKLAASAVTTAKIADANVTTAKIADANVTTAKIADANVTYAKLNADAKPVTYSKSVATTDWSSNAATVTGLTEVTADNIIIVTPAPASFITWRDCGIRCTAQAAGSITLTCETTPSEAITVQVLVVR